jgi:hypothetical protein
VPETTSGLTFAAFAIFCKNSPPLFSLFPPVSTFFRVLQISPDWRKIWPETVSLIQKSNVLLV